MIDQLRHLSPGNHRLPCPECAKREKDKTLGVTVEHDRIVWHCYRCGMAGAQRNQDSRIARPAPRAASQRHLTLATHWRVFWRDLRPITPGTVAGDYLSARGCAIPPADGDLRYTDSLRHPSGYDGPALVALVTDAVSGEPLTLHRTWIKPDGKKADVDPPRMLLGKHRKQGGVIRLFADDGVTTGLAIAEGIETALAVAAVHRPVWSCIDAGNLGAFPALPAIECLLIVADNDPAGLRAAEQCARRWYEAGREVRIAVPPPGMDAADLARAA